MMHGKVAAVLEYKNTKKAISDHVHPNNKIRYHENTCFEKNTHPNTVFINQKGVNYLMNKMHMDKATRKKHNIEEVYIATTKLNAAKNIYKIGKSVNSIKRVQNMNTSHIPSDDMYLCHVAKCYNASAAEQCTHVLLDEFHIDNKRDFFLFKS